MYICLCMLNESNIHIYACNKSILHIYKYNKFKYTNCWYKIQLDSPSVCLNGRLNSRLACLILFRTVPFRPFRPFFPFFDRLNGQPFNFLFTPKQNSLPPFTV